MRYTTKTFIEKAREVHGERFDYSDTSYVDSKSKVKIRCREHNLVFEQSPNHHLRSRYCCPMCSVIVQGANKTKSAIKAKGDFSHVVPPDGSKVVPLTKGRYAIVDEEDFEEVMKYNWNYSHYGYAVRKAPSKGAPTRMHRFILGVNDPKTIVDHINHDTTDNRRCNLRLCSNKQNLANQKKWAKKTSSKYKGVSWSKNYKKWHAYIKKDQHRMTIGYFDLEDDAGLAYNKWAKELFGEFARLNDID